MELKEFKDCFKNQYKNIDEKQIDMFYEFMKLLLEWNEKINLTAITDPNDIIIKHFIDSLTVEEFISPNQRVLDIGTGAGFPGIPIKITMPNVNMVLIDSINKKINFLKDVIEKLKLEKIETIHIRAEDLAENKDYREKFDIVTSRAVSNLTTLVEYMLPFCKVGGKAICMKGPGAYNELEESKKAIEILGGSVESIKPVNINQEMERNIIIIKKIKETPNKYPRKQGKPLKEPLK